MNERAGVLLIVAVSVCTGVVQGAPPPQRMNDLARIGRSPNDSNQQLSFTII